MRVLNNVIIFIFIGMYTSCSQSKDNQIKEENILDTICSQRDTAHLYTTHIEQDILDAICSLKEVKELDLRLKKFNYAKLCTITKDSTQNPKRYFYIIQVGYDNGVSFVVDQNYYYYCDNKEIYYLDTLTDSLLQMGSVPNGAKK